MSEQEPQTTNASDSRIPENETITPAPQQEIKDMPVDWKSLRIGARAAGIISAAVLATTYGLQQYFEHDSDSSGNTQPVASSSMKPDQEPKPHITCRNVSGVLRIVGVSAEEVKTINDQDDVGKIPHMYHQRDFKGDKADITFEWRTNGAINDGAFYTAARYHFHPYTERSNEPMLGAHDVAIPGNAYNLKDAVGEIVEIGHMKVCEVK